ncbi:MAG: hypothetical protein AB1656_05495 [Candidatus Omnitrophota bacterium]
MNGISFLLFSRKRNIGLWIIVILFASLNALAQWSAEEDAAYIRRFEEKFAKAAVLPGLKEYASPQRYDELYMGESFRDALQQLSNDQGGIAWGWSYRMISLNEMFRVTQDVKYLQANLEAIRAILAARDDKLNKKLWTGKIAPAWGSDKYAECGRAIFAVHTGMILYPMFEFLALANKTPEYKKSLGEEYDSILAALQESLSYHDRQYQQGPGEGEAHYIGLDQENVMENKPLPGNRLSAMGRALWWAWKVDGKKEHRERAIAIGRYIKNRLTLAPDGAYYWPYWLPIEPVKESAPKEKIKGEDISHGSLTMSLPIILAGEGEVFTAADMEKLGKTVVQGFARLNSGVLFGDVTGNPKSDPSLAQLPARWLRLTPFAAETHQRISQFYLTYQPTPGPLDLALLLRYAPGK